MSATNENDRDRLIVEDALALLSDVDDHLRCAFLKLGQWARTDYEEDILKEVLTARKQAYKAKKTILQLHQNRRLE